MSSKNLILTLAAVAAVVLSAAAIINSGLLKNKTAKTNQTATQSAASSQPGGPVDGTYNFKGKLTSVKAVSGGTEITLEWNVDATKVEKRTLLVTSSAKVTEGPDGAAPQPSSTSNLKVGQEIVVEATLVAKTESWTVNSVLIIK
ncbi:MAG TPA: hypothetical protein VFK94_03470, partial [Patescibacteria group bacterium]|nr:hypothetical protein [Patescibacteria group bacterium]